MPPPLPPTANSNPSGANEAIQLFWNRLPDFHLKEYELLRAEILSRIGLQRTLFIQAFTLSGAVFAVVATLAAASKPPEALMPWLPLLAFATLTPNAMAMQAEIRAIFLVARHLRTRCELPFFQAAYSKLGDQAQNAGIRYPLGWEGYLLWQRQYDQAGQTSPHRDWASVPQTTLGTQSIAVDALSSKLWRASYSRAIFSLGVAAVVLSWYFISAYQPPGVVFAVWPTPDQAWPWIKAWSNAAGAATLGIVLLIRLFWVVWQYANNAINDDCIDAPALPPAHTGAYIEFAKR